MATDRRTRHRGFWAVPFVALALAACMSDDDDDKKPPSPSEVDITKRKSAGDGGDEGGASACLGAGCEEEVANPPQEGTLPVEDGPPRGGSCPSRACTAAEDLGSVAGDKGSDERSRQGTGSAWFTVNVAEMSWITWPLGVRATLVSPQGSNYDLFLYEGECGGEAVAQSTQPTGTTDTATDSWFDWGWDDSQTILVEVRHVSGPCDGGKWTLVVAGNQD